jgi:photosystem II stability/assembly factor-like uncharacterized protein
MKLLLSLLTAIVLSLSTYAQENLLPERLNNKVIKPLERMKYFYYQRAFPFGEIPEGKITQANELYNKLINSKSNSAMTQAMQPEWRAIGPFNIGGRIKSIAHHPTQDGVVYAAAAAGGIWKTTDGGGNWEPLLDHENSIAFGSISIDQNNPDIIYAGTGEAVIGAGSSIYYGNGIYKTTDAGVTWRNIGLTNVGAFSKVFVHPKNSNLIYAGTILQKKGLYRSTDAGNTWENLYDANITDVTINPNDENQLYIAVDGTGIMYSSDMGNSWESRFAGIETEGIGRISVQMAPGDSKILYTLIPTGEEACIYKTVNGGQSWSLIYKGDATFFNNQGFYDNYIAVHPKSPDFVFAGGIDIFRTNNGSKFINVTYGYSGGNVHVDQHCIAFSPFNNGVMYAGNDGGIYKTTDGGTSWFAVNNGLGVTQFYAMAVDNTNENRNFGGTQDNGTLGNLTPEAWSRVYGGDGFRVIIDKDDPSIIYGEVYNGGMWKRNLKSGESKSIVTGIPTNDQGLWNSPFINDPTYTDVFYHGRTNLYVSYNKGNTWVSLGKLSKESGAKFTALAVDRINSEIIYAGNNAGELFVSRDAGSKFVEVSDNGLVKRYITDVEASPTKEGTAYVTLSGYGAMNVYKTSDAGNTWKNIGSSLPDVPVNAIAIHPENENYLFIATDIGVFCSFNDGLTWYPYGRNLPRSPVLDIAFRENLVDFPSLVLRVATHGRSMWEIDAPAEPISEPALITPAGGEMVVSGTNQIISWYGTTGPVDIDYSTDNGDTWTNVVKGISKNILYWNVPNRPTTTARVRVTETGTNIQLVSNIFTISIKERGSILKLNGVAFVPYGIAWDGKNSLYTTSFYGNRLYKLNSETFELEQVLTLEGDSLFTDLTYDKVNNIIYIHKMNSTDGGGGKIIAITPDGQKLREFPSPGKSYPIGLELVDGKLLVGDRDKVDVLYRRLFWLVDPVNGNVLQEIPNPYNKTYGPRGLCYDGERFVYQVCTYFPTSGQALTEAIALRIDKNNLSAPYDSLELTGYNGIINARGIDYDPRDKNIWLTDFGGNLYKVAGFETILSAEDNEDINGVELIYANIYPNPAVDFFNVSFSASKDGLYNVELVNLLGIKIRNIFTGDLATGDARNITIGSDKYPEGIYYLRFTLNGNQVSIKKIVIAK